MNLLSIVCIFGTHEKKKKNTHHITSKYYMDMMNMWGLPKCIVLVPLDSQSFLTLNATRNTFIYMKRNRERERVCYYMFIYINKCFAQTKFVKHKEKIIFEFAFYRFGFLHIHKVSAHTHTLHITHTIIPNPKFKVVGFSVRPFLCRSVVFVSSLCEILCVFN